MKKYLVIGMLSVVSTGAFAMSSSVRKQLEEDLKLIGRARLSRDNSSYKTERGKEIKLLWKLMKSPRKTRLSEIRSACDKYPNIINRMVALNVLWIPTGWGRIDKIECESLAHIYARAERSDILAFLLTRGFDFEDLRDYRDESVYDIIEKKWSPSLKRRFKDGAKKQKIKDRPRKCIKLTTYPVVLGFSAAATLLLMILCITT